MTRHQAASGIRTRTAVQSRQVHKAVRCFVRAALAAGWTVEWTGGGHLRFSSPERDGPVIFTAATPGDRRSHQNAVAQFRRAGLTVGEARPRRPAGHPRQLPPA